MRVKAKKLMQKNYNLVNTVTGEKIVVHPPTQPGAEADGKNPKKDGKWIRRFNIIDGNGVAAFAGQSTIVMSHAPKFFPTVEVNGQTWELQVIEKEAAPAEATAATV
jgi:hypothetical protein